MINALQKGSESKKKKRVRDTFRTRVCRGGPSRGQISVCGTTTEGRKKRGVAQGDEARPEREQKEKITVRWVWV
jgi:hypothetical protein